MKLSDFSLIEEHPDHYEIGHPKGRSIRVLKAGLSPDGHAEIKKMASGGGVSSLDQNSTQAPDELSQIQNDVAGTPAQSPGAMDYQNDLGQQQTFNPGEPPEFQQSSAIDQAIADQGKGQMEATAAANDLFSQRQSIMAQNKKRDLLGLPPLPVPGGDTSTEQSDATPTSQAAAGPSPASIPSSPGFPQTGQEGILSAQQGALGQYSNRLGQIAQNEQALVDNYQKQQAQFQSTSDAHFQQMRTDMDADRQAIINGKIDPNQFWNSRTDAQKAGGVLALILGGIGAGLTHGQNSALVLLNNQIDRNIQAQRDNAGKQNSLYSMELQRYGDEHSAYMATQAHMLNATQAQLTAQGMQATTASQQASISQAQQQIELQKMMLQRELANRVATAQLYGAIPGQAQPGQAPHSGGGIPSAQVGWYAMNNPKSAENLINLDNGYSYQFKGTPENAQDFQNFEQTTGSVLDGINQLKKLGASAEIPGSDSNRKAQVLIANLTTQIPQMRSSQIGAKRINEVEADRAKDLLPDPRKISGLVNSATALNQFAGGIQKEREDARRGNLLGYQVPAPLRTFKPD